ncbi:AraC family transcriptional regulator [Paenibacillus sp. MBLB4367]|uniref:AraC family transcriptional regulator n=1 Tax=Paenibacillus sp. MBLB4367 TaxID=3384767 RepID=UPI0039080223
MQQSFHSVAINPFPGKGEIVVLFAGHAQTAPDHKVGPQVLDYYLVHNVVSGRGVFQSRAQAYELQKGSSFFIFPGELVSYDSDTEQPWLYRWVGFKGKEVDRLLANLGISADRPVADTSASRKINALLHQIELALRQAAPNCDLRADGYMRLLFAEYMTGSADRSQPNSEPVSDSKRQVDHAIRWLTLQYSQPISIEQMAASLGYHRTHLSKLFKQQTGMSPMSYLLRLRMERAKLLLAGDLTIEQIASSVGFSDALYFSKQFKKWYGSSPTQYRINLYEQGAGRFDCSR